MGLSQLMRAPFDQCFLFASFLAAILLLEYLLDTSDPPWTVLFVFGSFLLALANQRSRHFLWKQAEFVYRSYLTLERDLTGLALLIRVRLDMRRRMRENRGIHEIFLDIVRSHPDKICIIDMSSVRSYTFSEFNALANRFANHFRANGYNSGDVVALFMENCAEFVAAWIGLAKIGVITVLQATKEAGLIADLTHVQEYAIGPKANANSLSAIFEQNLEEFSSEPEHAKDVNFRSLLCFIYTSGTTGMPKAACIKHFRYYSMVMGCADSFGLKPEDRLYISMPLYHTAAGIIGIGQVLLRGSSCAMRQRFSASNFWKDCVEYECTASQYIGEICRYLLAQPQCEAEKKHKIRLMFGNGLRAEIWKEFVDRFGVKIGEVYGSTEGTSNLVNIDGKIGACGFLPISPITSLVHPVRLVKVDENGEIMRRSNGLAIPCRPEKKVIHNVFRLGDSAFLTGDILHWDRLGYLYFRIRTGDTFRFKGENVSTAEVEAVLLPLKCIIDAVVYGIRIAGLEGSVGMAALVKNKEAGADQEFLHELSTRLRTALPPFAIPRFIRICSAVDKTGTFKLIKTNLQRLALTRTNPEERLFILDSATREFIPLEEELRQRLETGDLGEKELGRIFA